MREFIERLEAGLVQAAEQEAARGTGARLARSARALPAHPALTALVTAGVLAAVLVLSALPTPNPTLASLPVLSRPSINASSARRYMPVLSRSGARFGEARAIQTPYGRGYVIPAPHRHLLCVAIPDTVPKSYGETCVPAGQAEQAGIVATLIAPQGGSASSEFVGVLPADASQPEVTHHDGRVTRLALHDGVAAATFDEDVTIRVRVGKEIQMVRIPAHEPEGGGFADCGGGRIVREPKGQTYADVCRGK